MSWVRMGGGASLGCDEYCADDDYTDEGGGVTVRVFSTLERHFELPRRVESMDEVFGLSGVRPVGVVIRPGERG